MIALEEKNLQGYQHKLLSFEKGEHKSKEVLDINPRGQFPVFRHGTNVINESLGACLYLEPGEMNMLCASMFMQDQFKSQGNSLIPSDPAEKALMYQRSLEALNVQQKMVDVLRNTRQVPEDERHEAALRRHKEAATAEFQLWEGYMQKTGPYVAGKNFSVADVMFFPTLALAFRLGLRQEKYPKLGAYHTFLRDRPSIKVTWPLHWLQTIPMMPIMDPLKDV